MERERESPEHASIHQDQQKPGRGMWKGEKRWYLS